MSLASLAHELETAPCGHPKFKRFKQCSSHSYSILDGDHLGFNTKDIKQY